MNRGKMELLAARVAGGQSVKAAAVEINWKLSQAYAASGSDEFKKMVHRLRSEAIQSAVGLLNEGASKAVATLIELLAAENEPQVRLNASKAILGALGGITELAELRQRLDDIEAKHVLKVAS